MLSSGGALDRATVLFACFGGEQSGFDGAVLVFSLSQQLITLLENRTLHRALDFSRQPIFQIEAPGRGLRDVRAVRQAIQ